MSDVQFDLRDMLTFASADPQEMLREIDPDSVPDPQPPAGANYREAEIDGISCASCAKFDQSGLVEVEGGVVPTGVCSLWEAEVRGDFVSTGYAETSPPLDENGDDDWSFADNEAHVAEIHLSASDEATEESGFVVKEILRTGEWPVIPTRSGLVKKPLRIVRDGQSNREEGVISLSEVVENFKAKVIERPQIPLSDDEDDHKNLTRLNTGFVRDLWITEPDENGISKLVAKMEITEPDVRTKVLNGTYADVSCGIPWRVVSRGQEYGSTLEHVAITNRPFIDGLGGFLAASDKQKDADVVHFGDFVKAVEEGATQMSLRQILDAATESAMEKAGLPADLKVYEAVDLSNAGVTVKNVIAEMSWVVPYEFDGEKILLADLDDWGSPTHDEGKQSAPVEQKPTAPRQLTELEAAQEVRQILLSGSPQIRTKEGIMPLTREEMEAVNLSDLPEGQRAAFQKLLDENAALAASSREAAANERIAELEGLGLKDRPGFLKLYRQVMLADDGGPAVVLSDNGTKESVGAKAILDRAIDALTVDGKVVLSDQALASGNDDPPPANAEDEKKPVAERLAEAREALGMGSKK